MIKIPKDVHKALAVLFKHKLISQTELQQFMEKRITAIYGKEYET